MGQESRKRRFPLAGVLAVLLFGLFASAVLVLVANAKLTGSATLPNGSNVGITTKGFGMGFGVATNKTETCIEAGGYVVKVDDKLTLMVNGSAVGKLDVEPKSYDLTVDSEGLRIRCAERIVAHVK